MCVFRVVVGGGRRGAAAQRQGPLAVCLSLPSLKHPPFFFFIPPPHHTQPAARQRSCDQAHTLHARHIILYFLFCVPFFRWLPALRRRRRDKQKTGTFYIERRRAKRVPARGGGVTLLLGAATHTRLSLFWWGEKGRERGEEARPALQRTGNTRTRAQGAAHAQKRGGERTGGEWGRGACMKT